VLQRLLCRDALRRVVDKYLLEKIQKLRQELGGWRNDILDGLAVCGLVTINTATLTGNLFIALTNLLDALVVSGVG
jgi:hypothetical protein